MLIPIGYFKLVFEMPRNCELYSIYIILLTIKLLAINITHRLQIVKNKFRCS